MFFRFAQAGQPDSAVPASAARAGADPTVIGVEAEADSASTYNDSSGVAGTHEAAGASAVAFPGVAGAGIEHRLSPVLALLTSRTRACSYVSAPSVVSIRSRSDAGQGASTKATSESRTHHEERGPTLWENRYSTGSDPWNVSLHGAWYGMCSIS